MQKDTTTPPVTRWTDENIIDLIRRFRNDRIKDFLDERHLKEYVNQRYNIRDLSPVKIELIKIALKEHLISPVDLHHYKEIIAEIRGTDTANLQEENEPLFNRETEMILKRFLF